MKLWQKIFLPTLALMVVSTTLASTLLLGSNRDALWEREGQRAVTQHQYLAGMLRAGVISHRLQLGVVQLDEETASQAARQVLSQQALDSYLSGLLLLDSKDSALFDTLPPDLSSQLPGPPQDEPNATVYQLCPGAGPGQWYLVCAMPVTLESVPYRLCAAYAVGDLQQRLDREAARAVALCLIMSLVGAGSLLVLVWFLLRPLAALDASARRVALGHYGERLEVRGSDELADLAQDMNLMASAVQERVEQLEQVAEDRRAFIGDLAHEMKTPLTSILGFADLLYLPKEVPDELRVEYAARPRLSARGGRRGGDEHAPHHGPEPDPAGPQLPGPRRRYGPGAVQVPALQSAGQRPQGQPSGKAAGGHRPGDGRTGRHPSAGLWPRHPCRGAGQGVPAVLYGR